MKKIIHGDGFSALTSLGSFVSLLHSHKSTICVHSVTRAGGNVLHMAQNMPVWVISSVVATCTLQAKALPTSHVSTEQQ